MEPLKYKEIKKHEAIYKLCLMRRKDYGVSSLPSGTARLDSLTGNFEWSETPERQHFWEYLNDKGFDAFYKKYPEYAPKKNINDYSII